MELNGRVAVVTGAAAGIGEAIALRLGAEGVAVVVADLDRAGAEATAERIQRAGGRSLATEVDVADADDVAAMAVLVESALGTVDILVNNAGGVEGPGFPDAPGETWYRTLDVNLRGTMLCIQAFVPALAEGGGVVVNVASVAALGQQPHDLPEYAAAKAAVVRLTTALAVPGIRVACICPDIVDTPASRRTRAAMTPQQLRELPPVLEPSEIADLVVGLIRDDSAAGLVVECTGGQTPRRLDLDR